MPFFNCPVPALVEREKREQILLRKMSKRIEPEWEFIPREQPHDKVEQGPSYCKHSSCPKEKQHGGTKRRLRWCWNADKLLSACSMKTGKFKLQAFFSLCHCPVMVGRKDGFYDEREGAKQRLLSVDLPVIDDIHPRSVLLKGPDTTPIKIAPCH